jgi:hypothetical protein
VGRIASLVLQDDYTGVNSLLTVLGTSIGDREREEEKKP